MDDSVLKDEVLELTLACQQGSATPEERARLERLLTDYPQCIDWYVLVVQDTLTLKDAAAANETGTTSAETRESLLRSLSTGADEKRTTLRTLSVRGWRWWPALAAAVCLLVAVNAVPWLWAPRHHAADEKPAHTTDSQWAQIVDISNVKWTDGARHFNEWTFLKPGDTLRFDTGLVNVFLANGAELLIEGPADVKFVSLRSLYAKQGKLAARVSPQAIGLRIDTPHAKVTDRSTSFGMSIDGDSHTSVVVYEGTIDLDVLGGGTQPRRRLETGEALSVDGAGKLSRVTTVQGKQFLEPPQVHASPNGASNLITAVSDNVRSSETSKYYRVIPHGFWEDCQAYVDRLHEWNGIDKSGLPPFLLGGDYVMTYNVDKTATEFQLAVTVSQPANLYVLMDDRVPPPDWLVRDFVDTHWDVGSDEGYPDRLIVNGVGPGVSIDRVCSVWKRQITEPTTVILGALSSEASTVPAEDVERSMYGIVATPLRGEQPND